MTDVNQAEINKFNQLASRCWDPDGEFKPLHDLNPLRLQYIESHAPLFDKAVLDVGCGGGILTEALARSGAHATGIDMAGDLLQAAKLHKYESNLEVNYFLSTAEQFSEQHPNTFDVITCMEMLEHVPNPSTVIEACAKLAKPGADLFFSTLSRTPKAFLQAIIGAEYLLDLIPKGTHTYQSFIKFSELEACLRKHGLSARHCAGISYNPLTKTYRLSDNLDVNYLVHAIKV